MTFCVIDQPSPNKARSPVRLVERVTGREIEWINRYLDYECLRRLSTVTLRSYLSRPRVQNFSSTDLFLGTEAEPGREG